MSVFQDLYYSEINFAVSSFWDGGFRVQLGDELNGFSADTTCRQWGEIEPWLTEQAIKHYPDSVFAKVYRDGLSVWLDWKGRGDPA